MSKGNPETLIEAIRHFSDADICREYVAALRWPDGVACPTCGSVEVRFLATRGIWECKSKHPRKQFSVKVGTIFEDSAVSLDKWLAAMWMLVNAKNGVSSYEVGKAIGVTQATGWFMLQRLRLALEDGTFNKVKGEVEVDETYVGGVAGNMHKAKREAKMAGHRGYIGRTIVVGMLERHGPDGHSKARTMIVPDNRRVTLDPLVRQHVEPGSRVHTDGHAAYAKIDDLFIHAIVEHEANEYVKEGGVTTNGIENFWALLKRTIKGTYVSIEPFHLFRYLDEQVFRFNSRKLDDAARFHAAMKGIVGKRLTYAALTGAEGQTA